MVFRISSKIGNAGEENRIMESFANDASIIWGATYLLAVAAFFYFGYNIIYEICRDECGH